MQGTLYSIMIFPLSHGVNGADLAVWMLLLKHLCSALCSLCSVRLSLQACRVNIHVCVCAACFYVFCLTRGGFGPSHRAVLNSSALQTETHGSHRLHKRQTTVYDFNISRQKNTPSIIYSF